MPSLLLIKIELILACIQHKDHQDAIVAAAFITHSVYAEVLDLSKLRKVTQVSELQVLSCDIQQRGTFVVEYSPIEGKYAGKKVFVFGSLHTSYKDGVPFKMIHKLINSLPKNSAVLYESVSFLNQIILGKQINLEFQLAQARAVYAPTFFNKIKACIKRPRCTEMSLVCYLADKQNLKTACADLSYKKTLQFFKDKKYSDQDVLAFGISLGAPHFGFPLGPTFTKTVYDYGVLPAIKSNLKIKADLLFEGFCEFFNFKKGDMMFLEHIHARDRYALPALFKTLETHDTVMIAFGALHWNLWQDVLEENLGTPTIQYYNEYLADDAK